MKPEQIYQELKELAEKLEFTVSEQSFRRTGVKAQSGFCVVKNENVFIMDKDLALKKRIEILAEYIGERDYENVYMKPAVRELLERNRPSKPEPPK